MNSWKEKTAWFSEMETLFSPSLKTARPGRQAFTCSDSGEFTYDETGIDREKLGFIM